MESAYARSTGDPSLDRATPLGRAAWTLIALACWSMLITAARLQADPRGFGTHRQLGLPPCSFELSTHVPCPGCGLTTSFAHLAHGHVYSSFAAHLMGPFLFAVVAIVGLYSPFAAVRARPLRLLIDSRLAMPAMVLTALAGILTFGIRLAHSLGH